MKSFLTFLEFSGIFGQGAACFRKVLYHNNKFNAWVIPETNQSSAKGVSSSIAGTNLPHFLDRFLFNYKSVIGQYKGLVQ